MRKLVALSVLIITFIAAGLGGLNYINSFQKVKVELSDGVAVKIYKAATDSADGSSYDAKQEPAASLSESKTIKLKKGVYVVVPSAKNNDYILTNLQLGVSDSPAAISVDPEYSSTKLASLLTDSSSMINKVLSDRYPERPNIYNIGSQKMYKKGDWVGVRLNPINAGQLDTRYIILHKSMNSWQVYTKEPEIIVSAAVYPDIPKDVLVDVNNSL